MLYRGHLAAGIIISTTAAIIYANNMTIGETLCMSLISGTSSCVTSLVPDLDSKTSKISRLLPIVNIFRTILIFFAILHIYLFLESKDIHNLYIVMGCIFLYESLAHRKLLHSIWFTYILSYFIYIKIGFNNIFLAGITLGLIFGLVSHLIGDSFTKEGCPLFYPIHWKFRIANFKSGKDDKKIIVIISIICLIIVAIFKWLFFLTNIL